MAGRSHKGLQWSENAYKSVSKVKGGDSVGSSAILSTPTDVVKWCPNHTPNERERIKSKDEKRA